MADPLSVSAGVAGLVGLALHGTRLLIEDVSKIRDAPKSLEDLRTDIAMVESSLKSLEGVRKSQLKLLGEHVYDQSRVAIGKCTSACDEFRGDLLRWTRRSRDGKLSWRDKTNIGFFKERRIVAMAKQLQSCRLTLSSVVGTATLYSTIRNAATTEEIREQLSARQAEMAAMMAAVDSQVDLAESSRADLRQISEDQSSQQDKEDVESAMWAVEEEVAMLRSSQDTMRTLIAAMQKELAAHAAGGQRNNNVTTSVFFGVNNHGVQIGTSSGPISGISFGKG